MHSPGSFSQKRDLADKSNSGNMPDLAELYDQYAAMLLGIITKIVSDKTQAVALLEIVFTKISLQLDQFKPGKQPLFVWLLQIARSTALEALNEQKKVSLSVFQLTGEGKVINPVWQKSSLEVPVYTPAESTDNRLKELLDSILFKNCTPEEAALTLNIPVETARQQLRLAMIQIRNSGNR